MSQNEICRILIVDDIEENRRVLATIIKRNLNCDVNLASSGKAVIDGVSELMPDLILLDIMMPDLDGFEVAKILKNNSETHHIPIIFITAVNDKKSKIKAFQEGGIDYITKPFDKAELLLRINAQLYIKKMHDELMVKNKLLADRENHLVSLVEEKTAKIEQTTRALVNALENANFYNDHDTGNHIRNVSEYSALIAEKYGCQPEFIKRIKLYASLHDVGKVGLPDSLLKKPGKYTKEEFYNMQQHVIIGARMLDNDEIDRMARNIALYHHERWDGNGYVNRLSGTEIPLEARIVAIADVYDALLSERVYKKALSHDEACNIIKEESGKHFDPELAEIFLKNRDTIIKIREEFN